MKWLLYALSGIGGLLVLGVIVLLAMGGWRGEGQHEARVDIAKPPSAVFRWISQPEKLRSWVGWLVEIRDLTPGQTGVGARTVWVMEDRNNNNQRMDIESQVTKFEPDRRLEAELRVPMGFTGVVDYSLTPGTGNTTQLSYRSTFKYEHWLAKLMSPIISRFAQQKLQEDLARLNSTSKRSNG